MDIKLFSKCLKDAICNLERVAVPHLGVFQAELMPASYSDRQTTINPPYRKMSFRKCEVSAEEGQDILKVIAETAGVSQEQAGVELGWCLSRLRSELEGTKICVLPGLGKMKANSSNDFFFVPDADLDIYPDAGGLEPVCIKKQQPLFNIVPDDDFDAEARKRAEAARQKAAEEQAKAEEAARREQQRAEEAARREQQKAEEAARKELEKAEEAARREQEKAEEAAKRELARAEEIARREQRRAEDQAARERAREERRESQEGRKPGGWLIALTIIVVLIVLAVIGAIVFPDTFSDIIDHLLYSKEELQLLGR